MTRPDLNEGQREVLVRALRQIIDSSRFPLSPRIRCLCQIPEKLEPSAAAAEPFPQLRPPGKPSLARAAAMVDGRVVT